MRILNFILLIMLNVQASNSFIATSTRNSRLIPMNDNHSRMHATTSADLRIQSIPYSNLAILSPSHVNYKSSNSRLKRNNNNNNQNNNIIKQILGVTVVLGILTILGMKDNANFIGILSGDIIEVEEEITTITKTVIETAVPLSGTEIVSLSVGEGISGIISALTTSIITVYVNSFVIKNTKTEVFSGNKYEDTYYNKFKDNQNELEVKRQDEIKRNDGNIISNAVADGDYFLTRASFLALFETLGIPYSIAEVISVLFANIPYQFMKVIKTRKINDEKAELNFVELFADVTKWLEYDVLSTEFTSKTPLSSIAPLESASFGLFAGLSSQVYADLLYTYSTFGCSDKVRKQNTNRPLSQTFKIYFDKCLSNAVLFGVYTSIRKPISKQLSNLLSGGVDSCIGSANYDLCTESFSVMNPGMPEASVEAQFRAFVTAIVALFDRFLGFDVYYYLYVDNDGAAYLRSLLVTFYSIFRNYFPFLFEGEISIV